MVHADINAGFAPAAITVAPGDTFTVSVAIVQADAAFNAFDASIRFDPAMLTFVPATSIAEQRGELMTSACSNTFHKFNATPDSLKVTLSLLCGGVSVTGPGTVYRVRFRAGATPGTTSLVLGPFTNFYLNGVYVRPLNTTEMTVTIQGATGVGPQPGSGEGLKLAPPAPNPRRGGGMVLFEFDLPGPGLVTLDVDDVQGRRVACPVSAWYGGGRHRVSWSPPPLASGSYLVRLRTATNGSEVRRWTVLN